jgi:hypothetical protein
MVLYVAFLVLALVIFIHYRPTGPLAWLLAVLPALPVIGQLAVCGLYLAEEKDEFLRNLQIQAMLWGIGATLAVTTVWGFLENFAQVPHLYLYVVYPLFWFFVGISTPLLKARYK